MEPQNSSSQEKILYQIKRLGPQTVKALASSLGVTTMAVRQHLTQLETQGLIESLPEESQARGRPVKPWQLTSQGHQRFPDAHAQITSELINSVRDLLGESALARIIGERTRQSLASYSEVLDQKESLKEKLEALVALRTAEGYMAELVTEADSFLLLENHCPICVAASTCQGFCQSELEVFQTVLDDDALIEREDHLLNGARRCSYRVIAQAR